MRSFDEIHAERSTGRTYEITEPPLHTHSGCRFGYKKMVDITTYEEVLRKKKKEEREAQEKLTEKLMPKGNSK